MKDKEKSRDSTDEASMNSADKNIDAAQPFDQVSPDPVDDQEAVQWSPEQQPREKD